ncbi:MAG TPA: T9SS type A sorting domain-containing protein [Chitinophagales bacterium]|nr:T9SS type A sorting domain-containing protein [Chitinophagales bacterium]HRG84986.1 T9SS type A sorting domain-containing protein [Chitinophagales bacterium]HRH53219.1 T9SS type A sorting domain-containing protein [Chitinophagales bacterium]
MRKFLLTCTVAILGLSAQAQLNCANDSTGLIPITDLGTDFYEGTWQGGLYQGGSNIPPVGHLNKGIGIVKKLKPLDSLGNVNYATGKIVLAGFGASTVGGPFNHMIQLMKDYTDLNPCMKSVNAANGSDGITAMYIGNEEYWDYIEIFKLGEKDLKPIQVQVGWLMHSSRIDSNGSDINSYTDSLIKRFTIALNAMQYYYPNLKLVFVSGFPYGGYADPSKALYHVIKEPSSYHHNFAMKELIRRQISGDPTLKYKEPGKQVPYLIWGPPLWADGKNPRDYDGLTWNCEAEFAIDGGGYHLTNEGKDKLANILLDFFRTDTLSESWFMDGPKWASCGDGRLADGSIILPEETIITKEDITVFPNPSNGQFYVDFDEVLTDAIQVKVVNQLGEIVISESYGSVQPFSFYQFDLSGKPAGIYYFEVVIGNQLFSQPIVLN